jgi:ion channel
MTLSSTPIQAPAPPAPPATLDRRAVVRSALRAVLTTVALVYLYFAAPLTGHLDATGAGLLVVGLIAFGVILALQIRSVMQSSRPRLRGVEVLVTAIPFLLLLFSTSYFLMEHNDPHAFSQPLTRLDALYFTVTVFATVGFGDITATSQLTRAAVMIQMMGDLIVIGLGLRLLMSAVQVGLSRRGGQPGPDRTDRITRSG